MEKWGGMEGAEGILGPIKASVPVQVLPEVCPERWAQGRRGERHGARGRGSVQCCEVTEYATCKSDGHN